MEGIRHPVASGQQALSHMQLHALALLTLCSPATAQGDAPVAPSPGAVALKDGRFVLDKQIIPKPGGVVVKFKSADVFVPDRLIIDWFSPDAKVQYEAKNEKEQKRIDKGEIRFNGRWMRRDAATRTLVKLQKKLKAKIKKQNERKEWRNAIRIETKNFKFAHNLPDELFEELRELFEIYYKTFTKYWRLKTKLAHKPTVHIYSDAGDFNQIATNGPGGVLGYYHLLSNELHLYWDRADPELTIDVLFHETNHMLSDMVNGKFRYPRWIEEPMAEYYGASKWNKKTKKMEMGFVQAGRLAEIQDDIAKGKTMKLKNLIGSTSYQCYTWGWSFVHFMMETPKYQKKWKKFWLDIAHKNGIKRKGAGPFRTCDRDLLEKLLLKYTGHKKLDTLEKEWHAYVKKLEAQSLEGIEAAGRKLRSMGKYTKAEKFLAKAVSMGAKSPHTYAAYADVLYRGSGWSKALSMINKAIEMDPLDSEFYYKKGKILVQPGPVKNKKIAKQCYLLAAEITPDEWKYAITAAEIYED